MRPYAIWLLFAALTIFACVELLRADPWLPPVCSGIGLLLIGILAGLRWGSDAAAQLISDLSRTNSYLAQQNDELSEVNYELLTRLNDVVDEVHQEQE